MIKDLLNKFGFDGFAFEQGYIGREVAEVHVVCLTHDIPFVRRNFNEDFPANYIPCGSVPFVESVLGKSVVPNYYPEFLSDHLYRKVWKADKWPMHQRVFIKPADRHKRFTGFVTAGMGYKGKKSPPYWCSDIVPPFTNEWRYYIANGKILTSGWYWGDEINTPDAPELNISFPEDYCGAIDFGEHKQFPGRFMLVEANEPYACGWYGDAEDRNSFTEWLIHGWHNMNYTNMGKV